MGSEMCIRDRYGIQEHIEQVYIDTCLHLKNPYAYINTGVLLLQLEKIRERYSAGFFMEYASSRRWRWQDQDIIMTLFEGYIRYLDQAWNVMIQSEDTSPDLMGPYAPAEIQKAYREARNAPKLIHYIENKHLWLNPLPDLFTYYWKYAKKSPFYEVILFRAIKRNS